MTDFSYHWYGGSMPELQALADKAVAAGKRMAMTELNEEGNDKVIHNDLTVGRNSSWRASGLLTT